MLFNPRVGLRRDIQNMIRHLNHALALGDYTGGRVWIEDEEKDSAALWAAKKGDRELRGKWPDMHDSMIDRANSLLSSGYGMIPRWGPNRVLNWPRVSLASSL